MELDQQLTEPCTLWVGKRLLEALFSPHAHGGKANGDWTPRLDPSAKYMLHDMNLSRSVEPQPLRRKSSGFQIISVSSLRQKSY